MSEWEYGLLTSGRRILPWNVPSIWTVRFRDRSTLHIYTKRPGRYINGFLQEIIHAIYTRTNLHARGGVARFQAFQSRVVVYQAKGSSTPVMTIMFFWRMLLVEGNSVRQRKGLGYRIQRTNLPPWVPQLPLPTDRPFSLLAFVNMVVYLPWVIKL